MSSPCMCGSRLGGSAVLAYVRVPPCGWAPAPQGNASAAPAGPVRKSRRPRRPGRASFMADPPDTPRDGALREDAGLRPPGPRVDGAIHLLAEPLDAREVDGRGEDAGPACLQQDLLGTADDRVPAPAGQDVAARGGDHEGLDAARPEERAPRVVKVL